MLSTNVILLAIVMIGLIYLYYNKNFREGATGALTYSFSDQEVCVSQGGPCSSTTNMPVFDAAAYATAATQGHNIKIPAADIVTTCTANTSCDQGDSGKWCIPKDAGVVDSLRGAIQSSLCCIGAKKEGDDGTATGEWSGAWTNFGQYASASGMGGTRGGKPIYPWKGCLEPAPGPVQGATETKMEAPASGGTAHGVGDNAWGSCPASSVGAWCPPDNPACANVMWGPGQPMRAAAGYCCLPYYLTKTAASNMGGASVVKSLVQGGNQTAAKTAIDNFPNNTRWLPRGGVPRPNKYDGPTPYGLTRGTAAAYAAGMGPTWSTSATVSPREPAELLGACRNKCPSAICGPGKSLKNPAPFCYTTGQGSNGMQNVFCSEKWCCEPTCNAVNCAGTWENQGACSVQCGVGQQTQTFKITTPASCNGESCKFANGATRTTSCTMSPCPTCTTQCVSTNGTCGKGTLRGTGSGCPATEPACNGPPCPCDDKTFSCNANQTLNKSTYNGTQTDFLTKCCESPPPTACKDSDCPASSGWFRNTNITDCPYVTGQTSCPASICCVQKTCKDAAASVCGKGKTKGGGDVWCNGLNDCTNCCIDVPPKQTCLDWLNINKCETGYIPNEADAQNVCGCNLNCGHGKLNKGACTCTCDTAIPPWGPWTKDVDGQCTVPPKPAWVKQPPAQCPSDCSFYGTPPKNQTIKNPWVCETWDKKKTSNCTGSQPADSIATSCPVSAITTPKNCCKLACGDANCSSEGDCNCGTCPTTGNWTCSTDNKCICQQGWEGANCDKKVCTPDCEGKCGGPDSCGGTCPNQCPHCEICNPSTHACESCAAQECTGGHWGTWDEQGDTDGPDVGDGWENYDQFSFENGPIAYGCGNFPLNWSPSTGAATQAERTDAGNFQGRAWFPGSWSKPSPTGCPASCPGYKTSPKTCAEVFREKNPSITKCQSYTWNNQFQCGDSSCSKADSKKQYQAMSNLIQDYNGCVATGATSGHAKKKLGAPLSATSTTTGDGLSVNNTPPRNSLNGGALWWQYRQVPSLKHWIEEAKNTSTTARYAAWSWCTSAGYPQSAAGGPLSARGNGLGGPGWGCGLDCVQK